MKSRHDRILGEIKWMAPVYFGHFHKVSEPCPELRVYVEADEHYAPGFQVFVYFSYDLLRILHMVKHIVNNNK